MAVVVQGLGEQPLISTQAPLSHFRPGEQVHVKPSDGGASSTQPVAPVMLEQGLLAQASKSAEEAADSRAHSMSWRGAWLLAALHTQNTTCGATDCAQLPTHHLSPPSRLTQAASRVVGIDQAGVAAACAATGLCAVQCAAGVGAAW